MKAQNDAFESRLAVLEQRAQANDLARPDITGTLALMVIAGVLSIIVAQQPWRKGEQ